MIDNHTDEHPDYGSAAVFSEHAIGDRITYASTDTGETCTGTILWVQAPGMVGDKHQSIRYVVEPDEGSFPDIVSPHEVLASVSKSA